MLAIDSGVFIRNFKAGNGNIIKLFRHKKYEIKSIQQIANEYFEGDIKQAYYSYIDKIFRTTNAQTSIRTKVINETKEFHNLGLFSIEYTPIKGKNMGKTIRSYYKDSNLIAWLKDVVEQENGTIFKVNNMGNLWTDIQYNNLTKEGGVQFPNGKKPEALLERVISLITDADDLVLDSFLGSGTTAAVAQKMNRRWIGIEMGEHCYTHCKPRLDKVIDGEQGGISKAVNWKGGGGYKFYELAPTLIVKDKYGQPVFSEQYSPEMLVAAVAKINGYHYAPDKDTFWKQGYSQDHSYIYVTTQYLTTELFDGIAEEVGGFEHLLICAPAFDPGLNRRAENITVKKIPQSVLDKCEYGVDNYDLNIIDPPKLEEEEWQDD